MRLGPLAFLDHGLLQQLQVDSKTSKLSLTIANTSERNGAMQALPARAKKTIRGPNHGVYISSICPLPEWLPVTLHLHWSKWYYCA